MKNDKTKIFLIYLLCWLIVAILGTYLRLYPLIYHIDSASYEKGTVGFLAQLRAKSAEQVRKKLPDISPFEKSKLAKQNFDRILREKSDMVKKNINRVAKKISQSSAQNRHFPYLLASDSYHYYGLTQNIIETGNISDTITKSKYFNRLTLAPYGAYQSLSLHPFMGYHIYRLLKVFSPDIDLMYAISFTPLIIANLSLISFLAICFLLGYRPWSIFIGSIFFFCAPIFLKRSAFGWYDNDPYNTFFPLAILALVFAGLKKLNQRKLSTIYALCCALFISLYAYFWQGWGFLFGLIFISGCFILTYNKFVLRQSSDTKDIALFFGTIIAGTFIGISLSFGISDFFILFKEGWGELKNFLDPQFSSWPNLFISVGELRRVPLGEIIELNGGIIFVIFCMVGLIAFLIMALKTPRRADPFQCIVVVLLLASFFYIAIGAQRFALLSLIPLGLLFPLGLQILYKLPKTLSTSKLVQRYNSEIVLKITKSALALLVIIMIVFSLREGHRTMIAWRPIFNATWEKTLLKIKKDTPKESIVTSWWPPGHFITSISRRKVTFDGGTLNNPQGYWIAYILLSNDEKEAVGLLRMLNNSANKAADYLHELGIEYSLAVAKLKEIAKLNRKQAYKTLNNNTLMSGRIPALLNLTHNDPPPSYLLVYNDLIDKNLELSFIGRWNFAKIEQINEDKEILRSIPPPSSTKKHIAFLWEIIGGLSKYSGILGQLIQKGDTVFFEGGVAINIDKLACIISSDKFGRGIPKSIFYLKDGIVTEKILDDSNLPYCVLLFKDKDRYACILMDEVLAKSLLMRLFFFEGKGLKYFKPFHRESNLTKRTQIYVYEIDWEKFKKDTESKE